MAQETRDVGVSVVALPLKKKTKLEKGNESRVLAQMKIFPAQGGRFCIHSVRLTILHSTHICARY